MMMLTIVVHNIIHMIVIMLNHNNNTAKVNTCLASLGVDMGVGTPI